MNQLAILAYSGQTIVITAINPAGARFEIDIYDGSGGWVPFSGPVNSTYQLPPNPFGTEYTLIPSGSNPITRIDAGPGPAPKGGMQYIVHDSLGNTITITIM